MSRWHSYLNSAKEILTLYKGEEPFASFAKKYFAANKKFGSTDRKLVSHLCYCYFRTGKALPDLPLEEKIITGLFLCSDKPNKLLEELKPEWDLKAGLSSKEKLAFIGQPGLISEIFPWINELSAGIDNEAFALSFLQQPDLFLRLRPGKEVIVKNTLLAAGIHFDSLSATCLALPNASKINELFEADKEAVIQDYSSQRVGEFLPGQTETVRPATRVWDCCAGSGGKSIMAVDILGDIDLIVSDLRQSILLNLEERFARAGIKNYERFIADLGKPLNISLSSFNFIIADVPCTGSGTWARTPEQLFYFEAMKIATYADLQRRIVSTALAQLEPGGYFLYITCSVFKQENEAIIDFIKEKFHLQVVKMELLEGYNKKADTMFAALLSKPL